ncbi:DNA-directed RNA polymerases I, II, and III subunit RPABC1-like isoform X2 [Coccinella septempunctata]|uniref:DNA-directed RNA polymerases I, II, and III subunit RPABC1-like isoform X2 n=1 Tax=Coccinella septempunctata TaxID=41139 RepID=UPI001D076A5F|nr:DNA-directed RNA polymerases I, II, and III subunit RPABC1-like isoform X2 [Coccinella septempunctata]
MEDESEVHKLWRIRKTIFQMCHDRKYCVAQFELDQTFEQFIEEFGYEPSLMKPCREDLMIQVQHLADPQDMMFVFFCEKPKIGLKSVETYLKRMRDQNTRKAIIVVQQGITTAAHEFIENMNPKYSMEFFLDDELKINVTEHTLVPPHVLLTPEEKEELLSSRSLEECSLMKILSTDPVARYYGAKKGQVRI